MTDSLATVSVIESVVIGGDLSKLSPDQRVSYYKAVCDSIGLNPLTKPFDYITLNGKLTLYARKDAADQLRKLHDVSITKLERERIDSIYTVTAYACDKTGRQDSSIGAVNIDGLKGDALANAIMKAETKSKRRVTLSLCGLGILDETELETIKEYTAPPVQVYQDKLREIEAHKVDWNNVPEIMSPNELPITRAELGLNKSNGDMTLEEAMAVTNSEGVKYGDMGDDQLRYMTIGINKGLKKSDLTNDKQTEYLHKMDAIKTILDWRKNNVTA